jgi:hypothetical protein
VNSEASVLSRLDKEDLQCQPDAGDHLKHFYFVHHYELPDDLEPDPYTPARDDNQRHLISFLSNENRLQANMTEDTLL